MVDHVNRDPVDNRKKNLRIITIRENILNSDIKGLNEIEGYKTPAGIRIAFVSTRKTYQVYYHNKRNIIYVVSSKDKNKLPNKIKNFM